MSSRIAALSASIQEHSSKIDEYHRKNGIPQPTFDPTEDSVAEVKYPDDIEKSRTEVLSATMELSDLLTGPRGLVANPGFTALTKFSMTRFIHHFNLVNRIPLDGDGMSYEDLAKDMNAGISPSTLRQLLRAAMSFQMFQEKKPGYVSHSSVTRFLREHPVLHDCTGFTAEDMVPAFLGIVDALIENPAADDPSKSGYMVAHNASEPSFYLHLAKDAEKIRRFRNCISHTSAGPQWSMHYLTDYFPWESFGNGTVVDVGGSTGTSMFAVAERFPKLKLIVQDMADAIAQAKQRPGVNVSHMVADFFQPQPVKDADVYFFRSVMHNWPDAGAAKILKAQIPALKPGAKILIMDELMPNQKDMALSTARLQRLMDLAMLALGNSKVRDEEGWRELLKMADERFVLDRIIEPEGSALALVEVTWRP
ncbi:S-adenosyl-L-methionine-dependent methyltransferase [Podospora australis]|uniref:S-adenosyl-L-methionine-dependent methyltransferase n=1 Tax=Podospora australis TaxID=1536484 RepID=A0AAN6WLV7_9PEZI|nr:S-adenosyl-L-methionine-dependent methyltransferase [Podospora australis]